MATVRAEWTCSRGAGQTAQRSPSLHPQRDETFSAHHRTSRDSCLIFTSGAVFTSSCGSHIREISSPGKNGATKSLTLCFENRIILARNNESYTLGNCSRRVRQESSRITATSTSQERVRQSHALPAFPPFLSRRSSVAFPCLCRFEKSFVIPSHFHRKPEKKTSKTCADEHTRLEQRLPVQTPHIKRHTF